MREDPSGSPLDVARVGLAPKTFTTRRTRTTSVTQVFSKFFEFLKIKKKKKIDEAELEDGVVLAFSRTKGHGFLQSKSDSETIFFHVSDVNGEVLIYYDCWYTTVRNGKFGVTNSVISGYLRV